MRTHRALADLHMHTSYSDGRPTVRALLDHVARFTRLRVIAITDHDCVEGAQEARALQRYYPFEIVVGDEVSSRDGHILALFIEQRVEPMLSAEETIAAIHQQGGMAVAAHPFIIDWSFGRSGKAPQGVGTKIASLPFDGVETHNSAPLMDIANYRARRCNGNAQNLPELGCSDAHIVQAIGKSFTRFPGSSATDLRRAIEQGLTDVGSRRYSAGELVTYGRFYIANSRAKQLRAEEALA